MTVQELCDAKVFKVANEGELTKEISNPFCCDLLSIAMSKIPAYSAWVTIMGNMNTIAVASLMEVSCIILAEGIELDDDSLKKAKEQGITIFYTDMPTFQAALKVYQLINND